MGLLSPFALVFHYADAGFRALQPDELCLRAPEQLAVTTDGGLVGRHLEAQLLDPRVHA
jgi:2-hydroxychromene-2-carboxylate isomerase